MEFWLDMDEPGGQVRFRPTFRHVYDWIGFLDNTKCANEGKERDGQPFEVLRELTDAERDPECGRVWRIRFPDGREIDAWPEEIVADQEDEEAE